MTRPHLRAFILCFAIVSPWRRAVSQTLADVPAASRLRLTYRLFAEDSLRPHPKPFVARLVAVRGDSLIVVVEPSDTSRFGTRMFSRIEYSVERGHPRVKASVLGTLAGAAAGSVYGYVRASAPASLCTEEINCPRVAGVSKARGAGQVAIVGAAIGLVAGGIIGSIVSADHWVSVASAP